VELLCISLVRVAPGENTGTAWGAGADGEEGGEGSDKDIGNWE